MSDQRNWNKLASKFPYYAVVTDPENKNGPNADFWDSGVRTVDTIVSDLERYGVKLSECSVSELGVGVGRLASAMSRKCKSITGLDISPVMLAVCQDHFPHMETRYAPPPYPKVDVMYSCITLQHIKPEDAKWLIKEMMAASSEAVWFQICEANPNPVEHNSDDMHIPMYGVNSCCIKLLAENMGWVIAAKIEDDFATPELKSYHYVLLPFSKYF